MARVRLVKRTMIYHGKIIRLFREMLEVDGRRMVRETVQHPGAVVIVPMLDRSRIVFVRQYRRAIARELLELPAGTLGRGERRAACARRELAEETGWTARRLRRIAQFYAAPGVISEQLTVFLAQDLSPGQSRPDPDELLRPIILTLPQALAKIRSGAVCEPKMIIGVLFAHRALASLRPWHHG